MLNPFFKALLLLREYDAEQKAGVTIPISFGALRLTFPLRLRLSFSDNEISISVHFLWQWAETLYGKLVPRRDNDHVFSRALNAVLAFYTGHDLVRWDLKAPRARVLTLIAAVSLLPYLLTITYWPYSIAWSILRGLAATIRTALRPVPALLAVLVVIFVTGDAWRMFGLEAQPRFTIFIGAVLALSLFSLLLAMRRSQGTWQALVGYPEDEPDALRAWAEKTPAKELVSSGVAPLLPSARPSGGKAVDNASDLGLRRNIVVTCVLTMAVHVIAIALWTSLAFSAVGMILVSRAMTKKLSATAAKVVLHFHMFGQEFVLTRQLILLAVTLGCVAALTFVTSTLQSAAGRKEFADYALMDMRRSLGALSYYLGTLRVVLLELQDRGVIGELASTDRFPVDRLISIIGRMVSFPGADPASGAQAND